MLPPSLSIDILDKWNIINPCSTSCVRPGHVLVVILIVTNEEHVRRALAYTGANSSKIEMNAILNINAPKTRKEKQQLGQFIGLSTIFTTYPVQTRTERTIRNTTTWPGLTQDDEHGLIMFHLSKTKSTFLVP
jgi:hypothetical protein